MRRFARLSGLAVALCTPAVHAEGPTVRFVDFEATVNPVTALRIVQAIDDAETQGDALVLIQLDTPGGLVTSMEQIVKRMLASHVPIAVWVGPAGAKAASAGFFVLIAADVAAMAPGTRTGAAATVMLGGENREGDVLLKKSNEDLAALARSIAERRGRNVEASQEAVFAARAYEEAVALERGLIDHVADSTAELLTRLDGREVRRFDGSTVVLRTAGARRVESEFPLRQKFMELLAHPIVAYLLLLGGLTGIYVEFTHPGVVLPGLVGAVCLLLFFLAAQALPISAIGVLSILLAIVMFVLEIKVTSHGLLTVGGILCLLVGSLMLVDGPIPEMRVPLAAVVPLSLAVALACCAAVRLAVRAQREPVSTGVEGLADEIGTVTEALDPAGKVFVHGEIWDAATLAAPIPPGARVKVVQVDSLRLVVEPAEPTAAKGELT